MTEEAEPGVVPRGQTALDGKDAAVFGVEAAVRTSDVELSGDTSRRGGGGGGSGAALHIHAPTRDS